MPDDYVSRVEQLLVAKQHLVTDSLSLEPDRLIALRALVLEVSLMLPPEKQMKWLLVEQQFRHVDLDLLDLRDGKTPRSYLEDPVEDPAEQLRSDILAMFSQVTSLARE
jgi:hypothetical protein